jgi:MFS family permease
MKVEEGMSVREVLATKPAPRRVSFRSVIAAEPGFRRVLLAQGLSTHGDQIAAVALTFAILRAGGAVDLGVVLAAKIAALSVFSIIGGTLADRRSPRSVMLAANASCCVTQSLTALALGTGHLALGILLPLQIASSAGTGAFRPAATALTPALVADAHLLRANALLGMTAHIAVTVGPALGAALMVAVGARTALVVDAATFAAGVLLIARVPAAPAGADVSTRSKVGFHCSVMEGWSEVRDRRPIRTMILFFAGYQLFVTSTLGAAGPARADLIGGPRAWSVVLGAMGVGMILGGVLAPHIHTARPLRAAVWMSASLGLAFPVLAVSHALPVIAAAFVLAGVAMEIGNVLWFTTLQTSVPRERLARVSSFDWFTSTSLRPLGLMLNGWLIATVGPGMPLCLAAVVVVPLALIATLRIQQGSAVPS